MLENKRILIISPQSWGNMFIAKHHYAIELAQRNNEVYFLNPPDESLSAISKVEKNEQYGINIISYKPFPGSYKLRFKARKIYDYLTKRFVGRLLRKLNLEFDIVWSFETNLYSDLRIFGGNLFIYHPVDLVLYPYQINVAGSADIIFGVSASILESFKAFRVPQVLVNHGLHQAFSNHAQDQLEKLQHGDSNSVSNKKIKIGFIGNLVNKRFHRPLMRKLISGFENVEFHFWGPESLKSSNISGDDSKDVQEFMEWLRGQPNVHLHGVKTGKQLSEEIRHVDAFLLVTNFENIDYYDGSNAHKILEYLSTGKAVLSNFYILQYDGSGLILMPNKNEEQDFVLQFSILINDIDKHNCTDLQIKRIRFALENTYSRQIDRIEDALKTLGKC